MPPPVSQPLDYATPATRRQRFNLATWPNIAALFAIVCASAALGTTGARMIPGGPFISVVANVIPAAACLGTIAFCWPALRSTRGHPRFAIACLVLCSAAVVVFAIDDVMSFWLRPAARGALFGW